MFRDWIKYRCLCQPTLLVNRSAELQQTTLGLVAGSCLFWYTTFLPIEASDGIFIIFLLLVGWD
jgi:hypothetical protein